MCDKHLGSTFGATLPAHTGHPINVRDEEERGVEEIRLRQTQERGQGKWKLQEQWQEEEQDGGIVDCTVDTSG